MFDLLSDRWDGMSGMYLGKDWSAAHFLCEVYKLEDIPTIIYFAKVYENIVVSARSEELARKQKQREQQAKMKANISG